MANFFKASLHTILALTICIMCFSCAKKSNPIVSSPSTEHSSGKFGMSLLSGLHKSSEQSTQGDTTSFDLGDIHSSENFYFQLENTGQTAITDISLSMSDSTFKCSPVTIAILEPQAQSSFQPIIKVSAIHGTSLDNGVGFAPLMTQGVNQSRLSIVGKTTSEDSSIVVALTAQLSVNALVADFNVFDGSQLLAFPISRNYYYGGSPTGGNVRTFAFQSDTLSLKNTGNVPLIVKGLLPWNGQFVVISSWNSTLNIGDSTVLIVPDSIYSQNYVVLISVDGNNTITNYTKFFNDADGNIYLAGHHSQANQSLKMTEPAVDDLAARENIFKGKAIPAARRRSLAPVR